MAIHFLHSWLYIYEEKTTLTLQIDKHTIVSVSLLIQNFLFLGTMKAACDIVTSMGGKVALCLVCIELVDIKGREKLKYPCETIVAF